MLHPTCPTFSLPPLSHLSTPTLPPGSLPLTMPTPFGHGSTSAEPFAYAPPWPGSGRLGSHSILECPGQSLVRGTCSANTGGKTAARSVNLHSPTALGTPAQRLLPPPDHMPRSQRAHVQEGPIWTHAQSTGQASCPLPKEEASAGNVSCRVTYTWRLPDLSNSQQKVLHM